MTKSETISNLKAYLDGDTAIGNIIPLRSVLESAIKFLEPSLPSNLDEAAEKYSENILANNEDLQDAIEDAFKAGAEWMAGHFQKIEGEPVDWYSTSDGKDYCCGVKTKYAFEVPEGFYIKKK